MDLVATRGDFNEVSIKENFELHDKKIELFSRVILTVAEITIKGERRRTRSARLLLTHTRTHSFAFLKHSNYMQ